MLFAVVATICVVTAKIVGDDFFPQAIEFDWSIDQCRTCGLHGKHCSCNFEPQSAERDTISRTQHVGSFVHGGERLHLVYMNDTEYRHYVQWCHTKPLKIVPQSQEKSSSDEAHTYEMGGDTAQEQNVKFVDTHPGYTMEEESEFDELRDHALLENATLQEFFSRPIKILEETWQISGQALATKFDPWSLYFENPRVINRISNYKLMRSKLHIKVVISGNSFHYGRAILSYNPLPLKDELTVDRVGVQADLVAASQRPHIYLDPTNSQGGELILPFFYFKNVLDITNSDWREMGELTLQELAPLKHANGASDNVTISVFAWACDCKFAVPTQKEPTSIVPQADEYQRAPVSFVAGIVSSVAQNLAKVPIIAPFARATEIGADAVGAIATLFGYSRPVKIATFLHRPETKHNIAVCNADDDATKLTVDQKQELTVDPRTAGLKGVDEWDINFIASRESYLTDFTWADVVGPEFLLWNSVVDPGLFRNNGAEYHLPACAYAALPFKYWRGSMKFRFQVVCSKYHKGRLKIVYDPSRTAGQGIPGQEAEYNTAYTTIIDIADTTDFTIECGWGQDTTYRQSIAIAGSSQSTLYNITPLGYDASSALFGNGTIAVYVVNSLTVPNTLVNNDVQINVFVSMGDDFEVAVPEGERLQRLRVTNETNQGPLVDNNTPPLIRENIDPQDEVILDDGLAPPSSSSSTSSNIVPQGSETDNTNDETDRKDSKPHTAPTVNRMSAQTSITDKANHVHFGEAIRSFRQLVKRYNRAEFLPFTGSATSGVFQKRSYRRNLMPLDPGYSALAGSSNITWNLSNGDYHYGYMTFQRYATLAYGGWRGGMRYIYDATPSLTSNSFNAEFALVAAHVPTTGKPENTQSTQGLLDDFSGFQQLYTNDRLFQGHDGSAIMSTTNNPILNFEVPYYQQLRFTPAKRRTNFNDDDFGMNQYSVQAKGIASAKSDHIVAACAGAEDFTTFMFLGAPILYYEGNYPSF